MNVLQYKPKAVNSYKKWLTFNIVFICFLAAAFGWLIYIIDSPYATFTIVGFITILAIKLFITKNVQEIQVSNSELKLWVVWINLSGKTIRQEFDINKTLKLKVGLYEQPWWWRFRPNSHKSEWIIDISQKGKSSYYGYGNFSQVILEDLEGEVKAILVRIGQQQ